MFISIEGIDGSGKSSAAQLLVPRLLDMGKKARLFKTPGGTPVGKYIRELVLNDKIEMADETRMLMFLADMMELYTSEIFPSEDADEIMICDRYLDSTLVYQILTTNREWMAEDFFKIARRWFNYPDLTFVIDVPVEVAMGRSRARNGGQAADFFEAEDIEVWQERRRAFLSLPYIMSYRGIVVVDAYGKSIEQVADEMMSRITKHYLFGDDNYDFEEEVA